MTPDQLRFLALHVRHFVTKWQWIFGGGTLRASTERGVTAAISADEFAELVDTGAVELIGDAGVRLTTFGKGAVR